MGPEGCDYGNSCSDPFYVNGDGAKCQFRCYANCNSETEIIQDSGYDENGCWLGNYCVPADSSGETAGNGSMETSTGGKGKKNKKKGKNKGKKNKKKNKKRRKNKKKN